MSLAIGQRLELTESVLGHAYLIGLALFTWRIEMYTLIRPSPIRGLTYTVTGLEPSHEWESRSTTPFKLTSHKNRCWGTDCNQNVD